MLDSSQDLSFADAGATATAENAVAVVVADAAATADVMGADAALENAGPPSSEVLSEAAPEAVSEPVSEPISGPISGPTARDWREELADKMQEYRSRRRVRAPKYPSLQLPLEMPSERFDAFRSASAEPVSLSSLALESDMAEPEVKPEAVASPAPELAESPIATQAVPAVTNLIEFPRSFEAPVLWDGLAEPLLDEPRILEAPELVPPQPALGGILLEEQEVPKPAVAADVPLRAASIARRLFATIVDAIFVVSMGALGGWIFWKTAREVPPRPQLLVAAAAAFTVLWLGYQFLMLVWSGTTLGLRACHVELVTLDGNVPTRKQRRWRLLASCLSAASLMLGYAWALLDEYQLCWHDRITRTYLRVRE